MVSSGMKRQCPDCSLRTGILLAFLVLHSISSFSETSFRLKFLPPRLDEVLDYSFLPEGMTPEMLLSIPSDDRVGGHDVTILPFNGTYYAFRSCFFDVFVWTDTTWVNLYSGKVYGYNCFSQQFILGDDIFSLGGYGFYKRHSEMIQWSDRDKRWNMVIVNNLPFDYSTSIAGQIGDSIVCLFGTYLRESTGTHKAERNGWLLDIGEKTWKPLKVKLRVPREYKGLVSMGTAFDLKDFFVFRHAYKGIAGYFVMDKATFEVFFWDRANTVERSPFFFTEGNKLIHQESSDGLIYTDFEAGREEFIKVGKVKVKDFSAKTGWALFGILIVFFGSFLIYRKFSKSPQIFDEPSNGDSILDIDAIDKIIRSMEERSGQILQVEDLDRLFQIDHLPNPDYKRVRRSRLIGEINTRFSILNGRELIKRQRNKADKRLVEYLIGPSPQSEENE